MATAYISIMRSGVKPMLVNPSSTGREFEQLLMSISCSFDFVYCA